MQRMTWNGIALHGGPLPGYAASHGCVQCPTVLSKAVRQDPDRDASDHPPNDAAPVEISDASLSRSMRTRSPRLRRVPGRSPARPRRPQRRPTRQRKLPREWRARRHRSRHRLRKLKLLKTRADAELAWPTRRRRSKDGRAKRRPRSGGRGDLEVAEAGTQLDIATADKIESRYGRSRKGRREGGREPRRSPPPRRRTKRSSRSNRPRSSSAAPSRSFTFDQHA